MAVEEKVTLLGAPLNDRSGPRPIHDLLPSAGNVAVNGHATFELAIHEPSFASYDQAGDYSWDSSKSSYTAHDKVCLYRKGTLIWGTEPPP